MTDPSLLRFRGVVEAGLAALEARRTEVNDLNVFPVADGDTGDNMVLTLRAVLTELDRLAGEGNELTRDEIVLSVARAALLGARGNSGVILSQLIRGAAEELASRPGELIDPVLISAALARAADQAYGSVRNPAEGTILTVVREMATRTASELAHMNEARLDPGASDSEQNQLLAAVLEPALAAGQESVLKGPDLLPILRQSGVVDAGGYALTVIFAGILAALRGNDELPELAHHEPARVTHPEHASMTFRYCTNFAVTGQALEARSFIDALERIGDSVLVVGDAQTLKVHVHTDDPDEATAVFAGHGEVSRLDVADMRAQVAERAERLEEIRRCGALAVCSGTGMRRLFEGLGLTVLDGGPTLNPSTYELLAAIHAIPAEEVVVLPNSSNVVMAAERAAELSEKKVAVVATGSMQAGLAVAVSLDFDRDAEGNAAALREALEHVRTGGVAEAARDDAAGRFRAGEAVGYVDDELCAWGDVAETLQTVMSSLSADAELLTLLSGEGAPLGSDEVAGLAPDGVELEVDQGGQRSWWWLIAAE